MNPKIEKLKEEKQRNLDKIGKLQERNEEIDRKITEYENTDIIGIVRQCNMTIEELAELLKSARKK